MRISGVVRGGELVRVGAATSSQFVSGLLLLASVAWITVESVRRLMEPVPVEGGGVLVIGVISIVVNGVGRVAWLENRAGRFELADGGTIFLDEAAGLPAGVQVLPGEFVRVVLSVTKDAA